MMADKALVAWREPACLPEPICATNRPVNTTKRMIAALQLMLISPAVLFFVALVLRGLLPLGGEPAHTAAQIAMWYVVRLWTLWVLLSALPLVALIIGLLTLLPGWDITTGQKVARLRTDTTLRVIALATLAAAGILVVVTVHVMMN